MTYLRYPAHGVCSLYICTFHVVRRAPEPTGTPSVHEPPQNLLPVATEATGEDPSKSASLEEMLKVLTQKMDDMQKKHEEEGERLQTRLQKHEEEEKRLQTRLQKQDAKVNSLQKQLQQVEGDGKRLKKEVVNLKEKRTEDGQKLLAVSEEVKKINKTVSTSSRVAIRC